MDPMFLVRLVLLMIILASPAAGQTPGVFVPGTILSASDLNSALGTKSNFPYLGSVNGVTFSGTPSAGFVLVATGVTGATWQNPFTNLVTSSLTGLGAGNLTVGGWTISSDNYGVSGGGNFNVDKYYTHTFGGASTTGTRLMDFNYLIQSAATSASNTSRNYVAGQRLTQTNSGDGGLSGVGLGAYFGGNDLVRCQGTLLYECTPAEDDYMVAAGTTLHYGFGRAFANFSASQASGSNSLDAGIVFYSGGSISATAGGGPWGPGLGWHNGIVFAELGGSGLVPVDSGGCFLCLHLETLGSLPVAKGIDWSSASFSGNAITTPGFQLNGIGGVFSASVVYAYDGTAVPTGGTQDVGYLFSTTLHYGVFFGSGAPTLSAAKGSLYLRSDGTTTNNRAYINTDGGTTWTAILTVG